jgi:serine/threonine protein phosphatase PrpC
MVFALGERLTHHWLAGWRQGDSQRQLIKFVTTLNNKPARVVILAGSTNKTPDAPAWLQEIVAVMRDELTASERAAPEALEAAFQQATQRLPDHQRLRVDDASLTLLAAIFQGGYLYLAHLGDNRAYLLRRGELHQLTTDHTKAEELVRAGRIMRIEVRTNPARFVPTRWLGDRKQPLVDRRIRDPYGQNKADTLSAPLPLRAGDRVLICSPEIANALEDKTIKAALSGRANQAAINRLVSAVQHQTDTLDAYAVGLWPYQPGSGQLGRQLLELIGKLFRRTLQVVGGVLGLLLLVALIYVLWQPVCRSTYEVARLAQKVLATQRCLAGRSLQPQSLIINGQIRQLGQRLCPTCLGWGEYLLRGMEWVGGVPVLVRQGGACLCLAPPSDTGTGTPTATAAGATETQSSVADVTATPRAGFTRTSTPTAAAPSEPAVNQRLSTPLPTDAATATFTPLPPLTATPRATATLTGSAAITSPVTVTPALPLTLAIELIAPPRDDVELRNDVTFVWRAASPPPSGFAYQTVFWPVDKMPAEGFGIHDITDGQDFTMSINLVRLDDDLTNQNLANQNLLIPNKRYQWSVCLFDRTTKRLTNRCSSDQRTFIYKREQ